MHARRFFRRSPAWCAAAYLVWVASAVELARAADGVAGTRPRPNILFIISDDQSPLDLKAYHATSALQTPNLDRLAAGGMTFTGAYHMGAFVSGVCLPSRYMIKTGRTLWHLPVAPEAAKRCPANIEENTIAAIFNRAGYDTMRVGKRGNSYEAAKKLFTINLEPPGRSGLEPEGSAWHAQQLLNYLDERTAAKDRDPFLIYFGFSHPHDPRNGTDELLAKYGAVNHTDSNSLPPANPLQPKLPVNYLPAHPFPTTLQPDQRDETQVIGVWKNRDERTIRNEIGRYFACSENIDIQIGRVLQKLDAMGELENTWIFYTADHGIAIGRHGLQGKQNLYQHTWRVPFIAKGPGIKPGSRAEGNIYLLDVIATLCDIAGITPPETNEGISFKPVLEGRQQIIRDVLYGVHCGGTKPGMRCVKKGDWKLIKYDGNDGTVHETQLFNLAENPEELLKEHHDPAVIALTGVTPAEDQLNLAGDPRYADKLAEMEALLLFEMRRLHDPWRLWNQPGDNLPTPPEIAPRGKAKVGKKASQTN
jgi:choline-sulfatase